MLELALVIAHATRGVVIHADGKPVAVKARAHAVGGAICLESKGPTSHPSQDRVAKNTKPFYDKAEASFNATTNLVGLPKEGEKVSAPAPLVFLVPAFAPQTHDAFAIASLQGLVAWAASAVGVMPQWRFS